MKYPQKSEKKAKAAVWNSGHKLTEKGLQEVSKGNCGAIQGE
jgi:hypothetical protein